MLLTYVYVCTCTWVLKLVLRNHVFLYVHSSGTVPVQGGYQGETIYTHAKYALKFEVSSIIFLQISGFLADEMLRKAAGD